MLKILYLTSSMVAMLLATVGDVKAQEAYPLSPLPGDAESVANGINDRGEVVGRSVGAGSVDTAVRWGRDGKLTILEPLPGNAEATATDINARGQAVGFSYDGTPAP